jgi:type IV pilus assembly protein PilP
VIEVRMTKRVVLVWVVCSMAGCGSPVEVGDSTSTATTPLVATARVVASIDEGPTYPDSAFVESDQNRDPFRSYGDGRTTTTCGGLQGGREARLSRTPIDSMALIATVSGVADATAMVTDERGVGQTVRRGDYLGANEVVSRDRLPYVLTWRVDRIEHDHLVLVREDPVDGSTSSRVLAMHADIDRG